MLQLLLFGTYIQIGCSLSPSLRYSLYTQNQALSVLGLAPKHLRQERKLSSTHSFSAFFFQKKKYCVSRENV